MTPDVITVLQNNIVITQPAGSEILVAMAVAASTTNAERAETALAEILDIAENAPEAPSIANKADLDGDNINDPGAFRAAIGAVDLDGSAITAPETFRSNIGADQAGLEYQRDAVGAVASPFLLKLSQTRDLVDFIDKAQWPAIRNFAPTSFATNSDGQDSFAAALADMNIGQGGEIRLPDGTVRLQPQTITRPNVVIRGRGMCSVIHSAHNTADALDFQAPACTLQGLQIIAIVPRTAGAMVRARNEATKFTAEDVETHGAFRGIQFDGHVSNPALDAGYFTARNFRPYETVVGGESVYVGGGYVVDIDFLRIAGDNAAKSLSGIRVKRCADLRINNAQVLNTQRPVLVDPPASQSVASLKIHSSYLGTSLLGSRMTDAGGSILSLAMHDVWCGETEQVGANGLVLVGTSGRFKTAKLSGMEFPLSMGDGLNADGVKGFMLANSWADGNGGTGLAFSNMTDAVIEGVRCGDIRFGGNANGIYEAGNTRLRLTGNAHGNTGTNFINGSGASSSIQVQV